MKELVRIRKLSHVQGECSMVFFFLLSDCAGHLQPPIFVLSFFHGLLH